MSRPASVTAAAVVVVAGSVFAIIGGIASVYFALSPGFRAMRPQAANPTFVTGILIALAAITLAFAAWGIATSIGLVRMRSWARVSLVVFAVLLAFISLISAVGVFAATPVQPGMAPQMARNLRYGVAGVYAIPFAIALWWLIQFNMASTKAAFANANPDALVNGRPLSMSIIGYLLIIGGAFCVIPLLMGMPGYIAGGVLTGWPARALYAAFGGAELYAGIGLLALREPARVAAIAVCCLGPLNGIALALIPGAQARFEAVQRAQLHTLVPPASVPPHSYLLPVVLGSALALVPIWFLVTRRTAFIAPDGSAASL